MAWFPFVMKYILAGNKLVWQLHLCQDFDRKKSSGVTIGRLNIYDMVNSESKPEIIHSALTHYGRIRRDERGKTVVELVPYKNLRSQHLKVPVGVNRNA